LALGSVTASALADGVIHSNHLAVGSVDSTALVFGSIHSNHLAAGSVHSNALVLGSVTASALADGIIHSNHLAVGSVDANALALGSVTASALADGVIHSNHLADGAVTLANLDPTIGVWNLAGNDVYRANGNVGIGTATPQATLHVAGNNSHLRLHDTARGNYWHIYTENHPNAAISGNLLFFPGPSGTYAYIQKSTGNYFSSSDARLKQDVHTLSSVLDRVLQMRPVSYRFKSAPDSPQPALGFIAQEVEPLFPEVVGEREGMKSLAYSALVPVAIGAIQELSQKVDAGSKKAEAGSLKSAVRIQKLEADNAELKRSVEELKELVAALAQKLDASKR
jgi:hypothetical protein